MKKGIVLVVVVVVAALLLPGQAIAKKSMTAAQWKEQLMECEPEVAELKKASAGFFKFLNRLDDTIGGMTESGEHDVKKYLGKFKKHRKEMTKWIKSYNKCKKGWKLPDTITNP